MQFKLEYTVRELGLSSEASLSYDYGGAHQVKVELRRPTNEEVSKGHDSRHAFSTALSTVKPNEKVAAIFTRIATGDYPANQYHESGDMTYISPNGTKIHVPAIADFPDNFRSFVNTVSDELRDAAIRTVSILRWRVNHSGPHNPISSRGLSWSTDGIFWHPMPSNVHIRLEKFDRLQITQEIRDAVQTLSADGSSGPLHHDLFREAWEQRSYNPRSSLVIGMAASELAVKRCIADLVPGAEWLAINVPSPPLIRILADYFPELPAKCNFGGSVKPPPKCVLDDLRKGVTIRNQLSHSGAENPSVATVEAILLSVQDLLWLVDYYSGSDWAIEHLRYQTRESLIST